MSDTFEMVVDDGFDAAVEAQIAAATGDEPEPEPEAEVKPARERDEHGRYKPAASEPEPEPEPEPELPPTAEADPLAELKAAHESRLRDKDEMIARQANEIGQLRQALPQPQAQAPVGFADQIVESPSLGATYAAQALQAGDWEQYDAVLDAWTEVDPRAARRYERQVNVWLASQQVAQATEPLAANARESQNTQALANLADRYTDFPQVISSMESGEVKIPVSLQKTLKDAPDQEAYEEGLDTLYNFLKGKQAGPLAAQVREASEAERAEARQAKVDATVASASASPVREEPKTLQEQIVSEWADLDAPYADPWSRD